MGKWNASAEGCHAGGIYLLLYQRWFLLTSPGSFYSSFSAAECFLSLLHSHFPLCSCLFPLPLSFPLTYGSIWKHTYVITAVISIMIYKPRSVFQYISFSSLGWWDNRVRWVGLWCWWLFYGFSKGLRGWTICPRLGEQVSVRTFLPTRLPGP